jgi:predicted Zn-dependent protease
LLRSLLTIASVAAVGIGIAGAATGSRTPVGSGTELTSSGNVVGRVADDDREATRRKLRSSESGTYISEILNARDSALARWRERHHPLRVWIQPASSLEDWHARYVYEVHNAFVAWDTLHLPVRFEIIADSLKADVHVTWVDRFAEPISGRTRWARDENYWITDANIMLAVHHRTGEVLEDDAMHAMALHEVGHLLGLDHTKDPSCVMAPKVRVRSLSEVDIRTARLLYSLPAGPISDRR